MLRIFTTERRHWYDAVALITVTWEAIVPVSIFWAIFVPAHCAWSIYDRPLQSPIAVAMLLMLPLK